MRASGRRIRVGETTVQGMSISVNLRKLKLELGSRGADLCKAIKAAFGWEATTK